MVALHEIVDYFIIVNQYIFCPVTPSQSLKEGNPLSHDFFTICVKGHSTLITQVERRRMMHDTKICRNALNVYHLFVYILLFKVYKVTADKALAMKIILSTVRRCSGQTSNL